MKLLTSFLINQNSGIKFSKISGDKNKIHLDETFAKNSIYGKKICHGVLIILNFLKNIKKLETNFSYFQFEFLNSTSYGEKKYIYLNKNFKEFKEFFIKQSSEIKLKINIHKDYRQNLELKKKFKVFKYKKNKSFKFKNNNLEKTKNLICFLSQYVGNIYPGKYSAINKINIIFLNNQISKKLKVYSKKIDPRFPLVKNIMIFQNIYIEFETSFLPELKINFKRPSNKFRSMIKSTTGNTLIIGASSGIGRDIHDLYKYNKKINLIGTYNKSRPKKYQKEKLIKIDIEKDLQKILLLIKNEKIKNLYYFATPKINLNSKNPNYKKYYFDYPIKILKDCNSKINFFYPSTILNETTKNDYTKFKLKAEQKLIKIKKKLHNICSIRIHEINTRQNLMLTNRKLPNFRDYLFKDENLFKKTFFL